MCDYGQLERPRIPFPYYAEVWTGLEYATASLMLFRGLHEQGLECFNDARRRYDGERRNPWDEPECGHHYARAMSSWSGMLAVSGFRYRGQAAHVQALPLHSPFRSFWSAGTAWGIFTIAPAAFSLTAQEGSLKVRSLEVPNIWNTPFSVALDGKTVSHQSIKEPNRVKIRLDSELILESSATLTIRG